MEMSLVILLIAIKIYREIMTFLCWDMFNI